MGQTGPMIYWCKEMLIQKHPLSNQMLSATCEYFPRGCQDWGEGVWAGPQTHQGLLRMH